MLEKKEHDKKDKYLKEDLNQYNSIKRQFETETLHGYHRPQTCDFRKQIGRTNPDFQQRFERERTTYHEPDPKGKKTITDEIDKVAMKMHRLKAKEKREYERNQSLPSYFHKVTGRIGLNVTQEKTMREVGSTNSNVRQVYSSFNPLGARTRAKVFGNRKASKLLA